MAARRSSKQAAPKQSGVMTSAEDEAIRRCDFHEAWYSLGMTKGTAREAYFEALDQGLLGADEPGDVSAAAQQIAVAKPSGRHPDTNRWRRVNN